MKHNERGTTGRRTGSKTIAVLAVLAVLAVGLAAAAAFTPTATINDDSELGASSTSTNVAVTGSGSDAVVEKASADPEGVYESQNLTVEHSSDREEIHADLEDVTGGNVTVEALRLNSTSAAWETAAETTTGENGSVVLDISGNDTVKWRLKATFESATDGNLTQWSIGAQDATVVSYTQATDDATAFGSATLTDGASLETGSDSVDETAWIAFDSENYSSYTGPSYVLADSGDREVAAVELSNVSTDVTIGAEYQDNSGDWIEATNATVSSSGTHAINISDWENQTKWRLTAQNTPGGHAALTREGLGTSSSDGLLGGGGGGGSGGLGSWWDGLNSGSQAIIIAVVVVVLLIAASRYGYLED